MGAQSDPCWYKRLKHLRFLAFQHIFHLARSPVFAAMLEADMKEKVKKEVKLTNVSFDVIQEMMRYIYTGVAEKLDQLSFELLNQADKVRLER